jgi:hypothetical protein
VLLLAEKLPAGISSIPDTPVQFVRLRGTIPPEELIDRIAEPEKNNGRIERMWIVPQNQLEQEDSWSVYVKGSALYFRVRKHPLCTRLGNIAKTGIGLFSLANDFYVLSKERAESLGIEPQFLVHIAISPRTTPLVIRSPDDVRHFAIYCTRTKREIVGTALLRYIEKAEKTRVRIRGKELYVTGYHNSPRIVKARRTPWYNIKDEIDRRCRRPILVPRRIYERYAVHYNEARIAFSDNFVGVEIQKELELPLLALLNSSLVEYSCRMQGNIYGGGVCDMRPGDVEAICVPDPSRLGRADLDQLSNAYIDFRETGDRTPIDELLFRILDLETERNALEEELADLRRLSTQSKG